MDIDAVLLVYLYECSYIMCHVMVKMDPLKMVPPGTNFLINKEPPELILLQNMDSR